MTKNGKIITIALVVTGVGILAYVVYDYLNATTTTVTTTTTTADPVTNAISSVQGIPVSNAGSPSPAAVAILGNQAPLAGSSVIPPMLSANPILASSLTF
jgi:hypothetical protein